MKKFLVTFSMSYEVEAEDKDAAENEGAECLRNSIDNGEIFPDKVKEIKNPKAK